MCHGQVPWCVAYGHASHFVGSQTSDCRTMQSCLDYGTYEFQKKQIHMVFSLINVDDY